VPGVVHDIQFQNLVVTGQPGPYLIELEGADAEHTVSDVQFQNVRILDTPLAEGSPELRVGQHVQGVTFARD
jgi:hypothetical protein